MVPDPGFAPPGFATVTPYMFVDDADASMARAIAAGAVEIMAVADMPYDDRQGANELVMRHSKLTQWARVEAAPKVEDLPKNTN